MVQAVEDRNLLPLDAMTVQRVGENLQVNSQIHCVVSAVKVRSKEGFVVLVMPRSKPLFERGMIVNIGFGKSNVRLCEACWTKVFKRCRYARLSRILRVFHVCMVSTSRYDLESTATWHTSYAPHSGSPFYISTHFASIYILTSYELFFLLEQALKQTKKSWSIGIKIVYGGDTGAFASCDNAQEMKLMLAGALRMEDVLTDSSLYEWQACGREKSGRIFD